MKDKKITDAPATFPDQEDGKGGLVERLLEAAGPGPEIPEDGAESVKNALRPVWRSQVAERKRRRRSLWLGSGLAAAAAVVFFAVVLPSTRQPEVAPAPALFAVSEIRGSVEIVTADGTQATAEGPQQGLLIPVGSMIRTGTESRIALSTAEIQSIRLDRETWVRLESASTIELDRGGVYVDSGHTSESSIEIRTTMGSARDVGTRFEVRLEDEHLTVRVREGMVALALRSEFIEIGDGAAVDVAADGSHEATRIEAHHSSWAWVEEIAPALEIEGRTALEFLQWYSAETGLQIDFADAEIEQFARSTILHGTIEGLSPSDALLTVLPGSRLVVIEQAGTLLVESAD